MTGALLPVAWAVGGHELFLWFSTVWDGLDSFLTLVIKSLSMFVLSFIMFV